MATPLSVFVGSPGDGLRGCPGEVGDVRILVILVARATVAEERIHFVVGLVATGDGGGQGAADPQPGWSLRAYPSTT